MDAPHALSLLSHLQHLHQLKALSRQLTALGRQLTALVALINTVLSPLNERTAENIQAEGFGVTAQVVRAAS